MVREGKAENDSSSKALAECWLGSAWGMSSLSYMDGQCTSCNSHSQGLPQMSWWQQGAIWIKEMVSAVSSDSRAKELFPLCSDRLLGACAMARTQWVPRVGSRPCNFSAGWPGQRLTSLGPSTPTSLCHWPIPDVLTLTPSLVRPQLPHL